MLLHCKYILKPTVNRNYSTQNKYFPEQVKILLKINDHRQEECFKKNTLPTLILEHQMLVKSFLKFFIKCYFTIENIHENMHET